MMHIDHFYTPHSRRKLRNFSRHPLVLTMLTFLFTGVLASRYQSFLSDAARERELLLIKRQRTADAVKSVSDLLFERVFRGNMVSSSLKRNAPLDELRERKKSYDEVFVRYNSNIQSNLFRIREMFETTEYTNFEGMMEGGLRSLLETQDACLTAAYDTAISTDLTRQKQSTEVLMRCKPAINILHPYVEMPISLTIDEVLHQLVHCEYVFTDSLFRTVEKATNNKELSADTPLQVANACQIGLVSAAPSK